MTVSPHSAYTLRDCHSISFSGRIRNRFFRGVLYRKRDFSSEQTFDILSVARRHGQQLQGLNFLILGLDFFKFSGIIALLSVSGTEYCVVEKSPSWSRAHDWKSCRLLKGLEGSNPSFSARKQERRILLESGKIRCSRPIPGMAVLGNCQLSRKNIPDRIQHLSGIWERGPSGGI